LPRLLKTAAVPGVKVAQAGFVDPERMKTLSRRGDDETFADKPMQGGPDRRDAGRMAVGQPGGVEPFARQDLAAQQLAFDRGIDPVPRRQNISLMAAAPAKAGLSAQGRPRRPPSLGGG